MRSARLMLAVFACNAMVLGSASPPVAAVDSDILEVSCPCAVDADRPDVAFAEGGSDLTTFEERYLVVFEDSRRPGSGDIRGRFVLPNGRPVGRDFLIAVKKRWRGNPAVAWDPDSAVFLVVWQQARGGTEWFAESDIMGQIVEPDGDLRGSPQVLSTRTRMSSQVEPAVAANAGVGNFLVVWVDDRLSADVTPRTDIFGVGVDARDGKPIGNAFRISRGKGRAFEPDLAWAPADNTFHVVWAMEREGQTTRHIYRGRATLTSSAGALRVTVGPGIRQDPAIAIGEALGGFTGARELIAWTDWRMEETVGLEIYAQAVQGSDRYGPNRRVSFMSAGSGHPFWPIDNDSHPSVVYDEQRRRFVVVWETGRNFFLSEYDIVQRELRLNGRVVPALTNLVVEPDNQVSAVVARDVEQHRTMVVWHHLNGVDRIDSLLLR